MKKGKFFVVEGTDGSGKGTQFKILHKKLLEQGYEVETFDFPRYDQESSHFIKKYLNGAYGTADEVDPYTASLFFALDRYEASPDIAKALNEGKIVLANRYVASNLGHQGTKFDDKEERRKYFIWLGKLEFITNNIPKPDMNFVLRVPADTAQKLVDKKDAREYTTKKRDIHEADINHLTRAVSVYDELCSLFPTEFTRIDCVNNNELLSIDKVSSKLWESIMPLLPNKEDSEQSARGIKSDLAYVSKQEGISRVTKEGTRRLSSIVSNANSNVYSFNGELDQVAVAAAMARLSRRGDDMRVTLLDEFVDKEGKDEGLIHRVVTAYGDDSVQQLVGVHLVVENASNLLTKQIEWGRLAAYLEQSTRYIYYDQKDSDGKYKYYVPKTFNSSLKQEYVTAMDKIFSNYSVVVHKISDYLSKTDKTPIAERDFAWNSAIRAQACDAARHMLPVATKSTVGIFASGQALESLIMRLMSEESKEANLCGQELLNEGRKVIPAFLERADKPERGGATMAYKATTKKLIKDLTQDLFDTSNADLTNSEAVTLTDYSPRNELDIVPYMLYEHSNLSEKELSKRVSKLPYETKVDIYNTYVGERLNRRHRPGRALERINYSWDIICDYGIFRDLQRHRIISDLTWQQLTPNMGYDTPELINKANVVDKFNENFILSKALYKLLLKEGKLVESQYATLMGHKMRWKVTMNAREAIHFIELRTAPQGHPGYRKLVKQMYDKLAEVHPITAAAMKFVNKDEDPELTRLAAERYTQYKLNNIK